MADRRIHLTGVGNVRQLGGLERGSFRIKDGCLIRSAHLYRATEEDIRLLYDEYRLRKVIDLRRPEETLERPDRLSSHGDIEYYSIPTIREIAAGITHDKASRKKLHFDADDLMIFYRVLVLDEECQNNLHHALKVIIDNDYDSGSVLWHCSEGKDRCGMISAFILFMLGFDYDQVVEDYLITNETNIAKSERIYQMMIEEGHPHEVAENVSEMYVAKQSFFDAAYNAIIDKYKSIDEYFTNALHISNEEIMLFRNKILEAV